MSDPVDLLETDKYDLACEVLRLREELRAARERIVILEKDLQTGWEDKDFLSNELKVARALIDEAGKIIEYYHPNEPFLAQIAEYKKGGVR